VVYKDILAEDRQNEGPTFCPVILGSDKTTISVATGQNEYYLLYMSNGLIHNDVRRAHRNGVALIAFLTIPKADKDYKDCEEFRQFRRGVFHDSLRCILSSLKPGMSKPEVIRYADGYSVISVGRLDTIQQQLEQQSKSILIIVHRISACFYLMMPRLYLHHKLS
jgi:hypothetical protein